MGTGSRLARRVYKAPRFRACALGVGCLRAEAVSEHLARAGVNLPRVVVWPGDDGVGHLCGCGWPGACGLRRFRQGCVKVVPLGTGFGARVEEVGLSVWARCCRGEVRLAVRRGLAERAALAEWRRSPRGGECDPR